MAHMDFIVLALVNIKKFVDLAVSCLEFSSHYANDKTHTNFSHWRL